MASSAKSARADLEALRNPKKKGKKGKVPGSPRKIKDKGKRGAPPPAQGDYDRDGM